MPINGLFIFYFITAIFIIIYSFLCIIYICIIIIYTYTRACVRVKCTTYFRKFNH